MARAPAPLLAWYVAMTARFTFHRLCRGKSGKAMIMVEQLRLAMMPVCFLMSSGFISGITRGIPSCMRKKDVLSTPTAAAFTALGANSLEIEPPADASTSSMPLNESCVNSSTVSVSPMNLIFLPADRFDASSFRDVMGNFRSSSILRNSSPTAPVAPMMATLKPIVDLRNVENRRCRQTQRIGTPGCVLEQPRDSDHGAVVGAKFRGRKI